MIKWFHKVLGHTVENRLIDAIMVRYYHPDLRLHIVNFVCNECQKHKLSGHGFGFMSWRDVNTHSWHELAVYIIGPRSIVIRDKWYKFNNLTSIDLVTNLVELIRVDRNNSSQIRSKWEQSWLSRYPWPKRCIHDNGGYFTGWEWSRYMAGRYMS